MFGGDWGNNSDKLLAGFAVLAFLISVGHVLWDVFLRGGEEQDWQLTLQNAQNKWQSDFESKLADDQLIWQDQLDKRQAAREADWRKEEERRLAKWREEDIARQGESYIPKLEVSVSMGFSAMNLTTGLSENRLFTDAVNVGTIPVFFSNWGGFKVKGDDAWIEWPRAAHPSYCGTNFDFSNPLAIGQRCRTYFNVSKVQEALARHGYSGTVEVCGYYTDQRGTKHLSEPFPVKVESD